MTSHDDHHGHEHEDGEPLSFDERAATWDDPEKTATAREVAAAIRSRLPLSRDHKMLEYGAGTGLLTQALRDDVGHVVLTDVSDGMLEVMRRKVAEGVIPDAEVQRLDLLTEPAHCERVDLVTSMLTLHHVTDVPTVLNGLFASLVPGGHVAIADLDAEDGSFHGEGAQVHHGFDREHLRAQLTDAGFTDVEVADATEMDKDGRQYSIFLATALRP